MHVEPTLILPLIGSVESVHARQFARAAAQTFGGRVVLLRAVPHQHPTASRADEKDAWRELDLLAHELHEDGIAAETQVRRAKPRVAIIDAVRECDAGVVARSSYERHDLAGWLRARVIDEVMHQIEVPVLIVPAGEATVSAPGSRLRVLVPLDGSVLAESALVHVLRVAKPRPIEVRLVDVVHVRLGPLGALLPSVPDAKAERRATTRYLHDLAAKLRAEGLVTRTDVIESQDSVGRALLDFARRSGIDVVVMTAYGLNALGDLPATSVTTDALEHFPVPVLLVPSSSGMEPAGRARQSGRTAVAEAVQP
jgi:nucleotide-binding universal stress UspA family protein